MDAFSAWILDFLHMIGLGNIELIENFLSYFDVYTVILLATLIIIVGVLQSFLGFKSFKVWCSLIGLILGAIVGLILVVTLIPDTSAYSGVLSIFFTVCLGLLGAFIAYRAYVAGVFLFAFVTMFTLCYIPISAAVDPNIIAAIVGICVGVAAGVVAVIIQRICIIAITSLSGGMGVALGAMLLLEGTNPVLATIIPLVVGLACAGGGFFVQLATTKKDEKKTEAAQAAPQVIVYAGTAPDAAAAAVTATAAPAAVVSVAQEKTVPAEAAPAKAAPAETAAAETKAEEPPKSE